MSSKRLVRSSFSFTKIQEGRKQQITVSSQEIIGFWIDDSSSFFETGLRCTHLAVFFFFFCAFFFFFCMPAAVHFFCLQQFFPSLFCVLLHNDHHHSGVCVFFFWLLLLFSSRDQPFFVLVVVFQKKNSDRKKLEAKEKAKTTKKISRDFFSKPEFFKKISGLVSWLNRKENLGC